jgi:heme/copper-type cytochrome/quinol oxidase subunit 1
MHFLGFNVMPRRVPDFHDSFHSWNFLSSIGSGITLLSFVLLSWWHMVGEYIYLWIRVLGHNISSQHKYIFINLCIAETLVTQHN